MGGGGGVSIPGTFRIATDRTVCQYMLLDLLFFSIYFCGDWSLYLLPFSCWLLYFKNSLKSGI
jgi:hypothetical protein